MELFNILIRQVGFFSTTLIIGFIAQRVGFFTSQTIDSLSRIMMKVVIPLMILTVVPSSGTKGEFLASWPFMICCFLMYGINMTAGFLSGKVLKMKKPEINIHICSVSFQNSAILGYPIIIAMFPEKSGIYIAGFLIVETLMCWTVGILIITSGTGSGKIDLRKVITPMTIALVIGIIMVFADIHPKNVVWEAFTGIGGTLKYLGLLYIGADIGRKGFKKLFSNPRVFFTVPIKLIISPLILFFILLGTGIVDINSIIAITIFAMLPSMLVISILAQEYNCAPDYATGAILATTISCLFTMPIVFFIVSIFSNI
ncbi:MAG: AEC family transporter [Clostridia bacterium]|nr:AEC family transporter [Clostridia bacterium]